MAHHKRKRPKHQRGGCLFCKPQKDERGSSEPADPPSARRRMQDTIPRLQSFRQRTNTPRPDQLAREGAPAGSPRRLGIDGD